MNHRSSFNEGNPGTALKILAEDCVSEANIYQLEEDHGTIVTL